MKTLECFLERPGGTLARLIAAIAIISFLLLGAALISRPAPAQSADAGLPRRALVELLGNGYAEVPAAFGLAGNGGLIEVFASAGGATWTMVLSMPNGLRLRRHLGRELDPGDGRRPARRHERTVRGGGAVPETEAPGGEITRRSSSMSNNVGAKPCKFMKRRKRATIVTSANSPQHLPMGLPMGSASMPASRPPRATDGKAYWTCFSVNGQARSDDPRTWTMGPGCAHESRSNATSTARSRSASNTSTLRSGRSRRRCQGSRGFSTTA